MLICYAPIYAYLRRYIWCPKGSSFYKNETQGVVLDVVESFDYALKPCIDTPTVVQACLFHMVYILLIPETLKHVFQTCQKIVHSFLNDHHGNQTVIDKDEITD